MLVDQEIQAVRNKKMVVVLLSGLMAIPMIGALIAAVIALYLAVEVLSKSANRTKDLSFLLLSFVLYVLAIFVTVLGARGDTMTQLVSMSVVLFAVSYWTLSKMKSFL